MTVLYISGPFSHPDLIHQVEVNILAASSVALEGWRKGWAVICPHKNTSNFQHAHDIDWETWVRGDLEFLLRMDPGKGDAICMLPGWQRSAGARREKRLAEQCGLRIIDYEAEGLPEAAAEIPFPATGKYRKRPIVVEAEQLAERIEIETLEGVMVGRPGDWIITGVAGERYPCRDDIFRETYEPVTEAHAPD